MARTASRSVASSLHHQSNSARASSLPDRPGPGRPSRRRPAHPAGSTKTFSGCRSRWQRISRAGSTARTAAHACGNIVSPSLSRAAQGAPDMSAGSHSRGRARGRTRGRVVRRRSVRPMPPERTGADPRATPRAGARCRARRRDRAQVQPVVAPEPRAIARGLQVAAVAGGMAGRGAHPGFSRPADEVELDPDRGLRRWLVEDVLQRVAGRADLEAPDLSQRSARPRGHPDIAGPAERRPCLRDKLFDPDHRTPAKIGRVLSVTQDSPFVRPAHRHLRVESHGHRGGTLTHEQMAGHRDPIVAELVGLIVAHLRRRRAGPAVRAAAVPGADPRRTQ